MRHRLPVVVFATFCLIGAGAAQAADPIVIDFESSTLGSSAEGPGAVHPFLDIQSPSGQSIVLGTGIGDVRYTSFNEDPEPAPVVASSATATVKRGGTRERSGGATLSEPSFNAVPIANDCLGAPGCWATGSPVDCGYGQGFADMSSSCDTTHDYTFTFPVIATVESFSISMLDFGDYNPCGGTSAVVGLYAFADATPQPGELPIAVDELLLDTSGALVPEGPASSTFGDLSITGDACTAVAGEPGNYTLVVTTPGIARVELRMTGALDFNAAFDNIILQEVEDVQEPGPALVDIHPTSCPNPINTGAGGVTPVAIVGGPGVDVSLINPGSVRMLGLAPLRWAYEDVVSPYTGELETCRSCTTAGPDGWTDLTLKFDQPDFVAALEQSFDVTDGACLAVEVTWELTADEGGEAFSASDIVTVRKKGKE